MVAVAVVTPDHVERRIYDVRGDKVMLDNELAELYGVTTKVFNQSVGRNLDRFPEDFRFQLTREEYDRLRSQFVTSKKGRGGRRYLPYVFTEQGVAMLSSVLNSDRAVQVNIAIMRAFVRMRRLLATPGELVAQLNQLADSVQFHEEQLKTIADVLRRMMEPTPEQPKRKIGFHTEMKSPHASNGKPMPGARA